MKGIIRNGEGKNPCNERGLSYGKSTEYKMMKKGKLIVTKKHEPLGLLFTI